MWHKAGNWLALDKVYIHTLSWGYGKLCLDDCKYKNKTP